MDSLSSGIVIVKTLSVAFLRQRLFTRSRLIIEVLTKSAVIEVIGDINREEVVLGSDLEEDRSDVRRVPTISQLVGGVRVGGSS